MGNAEYMGSVEKSWGLYGCIDPGAFLPKVSTYKLVPTNIFDIPAAQNTNVANVFYKPFKKTGDFDESIHITKDQVDVKSQNQLILFFFIQEENVGSKRMICHTYNFFVIKLQ